MKQMKSFALAFIFIQCIADDVQFSVWIFGFDVGKSVVELTMACEFECVDDNIDMHNEPG